MIQELRKAGANWVDGDRFFDRESELKRLMERVQDGTHTLLTAQRRMGKTSLVRELLRRLDNAEAYETVFVDLERAHTASDAIAELAVQAQSVQTAGHRIRDVFANALQNLSRRVEEISLNEMKIKLRAGIDEGNWQLRGDQVLAALAESSKPVVLAIDELPLLVNRLLKGYEYQITPERRQATDRFLSWLRQSGQEQRGIVMIVSGSIGLEPILQQAGLSAQINIFSPFELRPWSRETAVECLGALAHTYALDLPSKVRFEMCRRLRCCVPHHVQQFFDLLHKHLHSQNRKRARLDDVERVYTHDLLGVRGQIDLDHYEGRLKLVLGREDYRIALELLTETAVNDGLLTNAALARYRDLVDATDESEHLSLPSLLYILQHDGYLEVCDEGFRFVSGLVEDWWRARHGTHFLPWAQR